MSNMIATGAYIWQLRETAGLTRDEVAYISGTNNVQVMRIEKGQIDTRGSLLLAIVKNLNGSAEHIAQLLLDKNATAEQGRTLAQEWLADSHKRTISLINSTKQTGKVAELLVLAQKLEGVDPSALDRLIGYGQSLLDQNR